MEIDKAEIKAKELIKQYCPEYTFIWGNGKSLFGYCNYIKKEISLSQSLTALNSEAEVINTLLHEIAHALTPKQYHNRVWQEKAKSIGCDGLRCYNSQEVIRQPFKWKGVCPNCHRETFRYSRRHISCGRCSHVYNPKFKIQWSKL